MNYLPNIKLSDFNYELPKAKIADYPLKNRDSSKLLCWSNGKIEDRMFRDIIDIIPANSHIIFNSTKVISARLRMLKPTGGKCELLLVDAIQPSLDPAIVMQTKNKCLWNCMIGGRNVKEGMIILPEIETETGLTAKVISRLNNYGEIEFSWDGKFSFADIIAKAGLIPLPPYIERETEDSDSERYQTVYAKSSGSVAAPTAGLHFTDEIINKLGEKGIKKSEVTLHVGPGTFLPVSYDDVKTHDMHDEMFIISKSTILTIIESIKMNRNIIAVGTTSVRTLESLYWFGVKLLKKENIDMRNILLHQDEPYRLMKSGNILCSDSLETVIKWMESEKLNVIIGRTKLFIMPGYEFKLYNGIITNFHLPKSTLILLVSAFTGSDEWRKVYNFALQNNYRFLSYGDSSFLFKRKLDV
ncbi:MAG: S-adenosylmethionine:tRNA ribosyltransferase-isomerase [Candidatus Kapabacteria bacterium]|nr:S-adenosylmethionine:tRNA ribosyltransferase-isomerase [Ignavibacteriota bacterium]MCW5883532.1 S-adenosylmethionine:tRNA ribosyltransferase-isomerase [Candidatus Kapabacteria bacterium]